MSIKYGEGMQVVPLLIKEGAVNDESNFVRVGGAHWVTFLVTIGDVDTAITITVESSSANSTNATSETIPFFYRLSGAASDGSDTWSAITSADSTGFALTAATDTGKAVLIELDPRTLSEGQTHVHVRTAATSYNSPTPATAVVAFLEPRYSQLDPVSAT